MIKDRAEQLRVLHLIYDHPGNPWCGGGGAGRTWAINDILSKRHDISVFCGAFPGAEPQDFPYKVRFLGQAKRYVESRINYILESRKVDARPFDLIVEEFSYYAPIFSRFSGQPMVTVLQGRHGLSALRFRGMYGLVSLVSEYFVLPFRRSVIVVSEHLRPAVHSNARVAVIGQGADIPDDLPPSAEEYVLFLGRLDVWHKGLDILLKAWAQIPLAMQNAMPLHIIGGGNEVEIHDLITSTGVKNVHFKGRLDHREALAAIKRAAFLCMPSRMEGSPLVLYEAFALGKPVIGTSIPAMKGLIPNGIAGLKVPPEDPEALANAIESLLTDPDMRSRMAKGALQIGKEFRWDKIAEAQERFYLETVELSKRK